MKVHYYYVESEVELPATAPTILWTNGGPGPRQSTPHCACLAALMPCA